MHTLKMQHHTYRPGNGVCVFCLKNFPLSKLTDEHIIPEAIHGELVIEKGACRQCAELSNQRYENEALNSDLQLARVLLGLRGKRGAAAPDVRHLPAVYRGDTTQGGEGERILDFPVELYPKCFNLRLFAPPGFLAGVDRGGFLADPRLQIFYVGGPELVGSFTVEESFRNGPFATMLAKIGYCFAAAEKGFAAFDGTDIRALLRGEREDVYNFVDTQDEPERLTNRHLHKLYLREINGWLVVLVHLFASLSDSPAGAIPYQVVVGRVTV